MTTDTVKQNTKTQPPQSGNTSESKQLLECLCSSIDDRIKELMHTHNFTGRSNYLGFGEHSKGCSCSCVACQHSLPQVTNQEKVWLLKEVKKIVLSTSKKLDAH